MSQEKTKLRILPETIKLIKLTDEEYFSPQYREYISNSKLGLADPECDGSKEKFFDGFDSEYSASFEMGSAIHAMILQPDEYHISKIKKPSGKLGLFAEYVYEFRQQGNSIEKSISLASEKANYYSGKLTVTRLKTALKQVVPYYIQRLKYNDDIPGKVTLYLSEANSTKFDNCMQGINSDPSIKNTLYPKGLLSDAEFYNEYAIFAEVEIEFEDGSKKLIKVKAKLDNFTVDHETQTFTLNDLKTTGKPVNFFMGNNVWSTDSSGKSQCTWYDGSFQKYKYYRQMGMYLWLLSCYLQSKGIKYSPKANMVVVETIPNFKTKIYSVNSEQISKGLADFKKLLILVSEWIEN